MLIVIVLDSVLITPSSGRSAVNRPEWGSVLWCPDFSLGVLAILLDLRGPRDCIKEMLVNE